MHIQYVKADPSGNETIFVLNPVAPALHSTVAARLLQPDCVGAEQVAYLTLTDGKPIRVDMMGGEFCGNASRSAAAYALMLSGRKEGEYSVSCSGCSTLLQAQASLRPEGGYNAYIEMPMPESIEAVILDVGGWPSRFYRVALPGIVHFVHMAGDIHAIDTNVFWQAVYDYASDEGLEAFGLILFSPQTLTMIPAVYVAATQSLYWEKSCGSGSAAVAAALACMGKKDVSCQVRQPGGVLSIAATVKEGVLQSLYIGGPVTFTKQREIDIPGV